MMSVTRAGQHEIKVFENSMTFVPVENSSEALSGYCVEELGKYSFEDSQMRGQGYDNSNMKCSCSGLAYGTESKGFLYSVRRSWLKPFAGRYSQSFSQCRLCCLISESTCSSPQQRSVGLFSETTYQASR